MKIECKECKKVTEHFFTGLFSDGNKLFKCENCHQEAWIQLANIQIAKSFGDSLKASLLEIFEKY